MGVDAIRTASGGVAEPCVLIDARNHAVVHEETVFRAHQTVATFAGLQRAHHIGVEHVEELARVRSFDDQLTKGGGIQEAEVVAGVLDLAVDRIVNSFARTHIGVWAPPMADRLPMGTVAVVPVVHRRLA